jgi:hypothetical protein
MDIALVQQTTANGLPSPALEQHVVGHDDRRPSTLSSVLTCSTKLTCLFDVDAQKSSRTTVND